MATSSTKLAPLETISYERLLSGSPAEHARLLDAARSLGFFYLDLRGPATNHYLNSVNDLYGASETYFAQPEDVKMADFREDIEYGYKPSPIDASLELPFDILSAPVSRASSTPTPGTIPPQLTRYTGAVHTFSSISHTITHTLLSSLGASLGLTEPLSAAHAAHLPSASGLKVVNEPLQPTVAGVVDNKHTDGGSLTLLFCREWGTHLCLRDDDWGFIEPREGYAVVNVADSLARLTAGRWGVSGERGERGERGLRSAVHRVTQPCDGAAERVFVLYFLRPARAE